MWWNRWLGSAEVSLRVAAAVQAAAAQRAGGSAARTPQSYIDVPPTEEELVWARSVADESICTPRTADESMRNTCGGSGSGSGSGSGGEDEEMSEGGHLQHES